MTGQIYRNGVPLDPSDAQAASAQTVESFGVAQLINGQATVTLDTETADAIGGGTYQVVLTEYGNLGGLYVHQRGPRAFQVRSRGAAAGSFGYRVTAEGTPASCRAAEAAAPSRAIPDDVPVPTAPERPKPEVPRPGRQGRPDAR